MNVVEAVETLPKTGQDRATAACVVPARFGATARRGLAKAVDGLLEISVAGSFSRAGYVIRRRLEDGRDPGCLEGKTMIVTGASSGIGQAAAVSWLPWVLKCGWSDETQNVCVSAARQPRRWRRTGRVHTAEVDVRQR